MRIKKYILCDLIKNCVCSSDENNVTVDYRERQKRRCEILKTKYADNGAYTCALNEKCPITHKDNKKHKCFIEEMDIKEVLDGLKSEKEINKFMFLLIKDNKK